MIVKELKIPAAGTWSKDCKMLRKNNPDVPRICIEYYKESNNTYWRIKFGMVIASKVTSEEFALFGYLENLPINSEYYFYEIEDSPWLDEFRASFNEHLVNKFKHYVFCMRQEIFEILSDRFEAEKLENLVAEK